MTETEVKTETGEAVPKLKEPEKPKKTKYFVDKKALLVKAAVILTALSVLFRLIGYWGFWRELSSDNTYTNVLLPILCCVLFAVFIMLVGKKALWMTSVPVFFAAVFLILETAQLTVWWVKAVSILLYVVAACVYTMTVFGKIRTKWLLVVTIGTPLVYHLAVQDRTTLLMASTPTTLLEWMPELSAMSFLIALLFVALSMEKVKPDMYAPEQDVPQINGLKHVPAELAYTRPEKKNESQLAKTPEIDGGAPEPEKLPQAPQAENTEVQNEPEDQEIQQ